MSETGRRTAAVRSLNPTVVLGVLLPLVTVGVLLLVQTHDPVPPARPPATSTLADAALACPSAPRGGPEAIVLGTALEDADGAATVSTGASSEPVEESVRSGRVAVADVGSGPAVVRASDDLAPGLLAARFDTRPLAAVDCPAPGPSTWFTGVGAGARHSSVLELVNPDSGPAVADIAVYGRRGLVDAPRLRGVTVPARDSVRLDLAAVVPKRSELALNVVVSRGRIAASVLDEVPELGTRPQSFDWLPGQTEPATDTTLLGLAPGAGTRTLTVANPGEDEVRVSVRVLTEDASFVPEGLDEVRVPPLGVSTVSLGGVLREAMKDGAIGLQVTATAPITSSLRTTSGDDLSFAAPVLPVEEPMTLAVPTGTGSVVLGAAASAGVATVTAYAADGEQLREERIELRPGTGGVIDLPKGTALVRLTPQRTSVHAAALVTDPGATVVGFRERAMVALLPDVEPGQP